MTELRDSNVDYDMLTQHNITWQWHQPWQVSLFHPDLPDGYKFVWYPEKGTLMYEQGLKHTCKLGEFTDTEDVIGRIMDRV